MQELQRTRIPTKSRMRSSHACGEWVKMHALKPHDLVTLRMSCRVIGPQ